jgi:hypothetical protein
MGRASDRAIRRVPEQAQAASGSVAQVNETTPEHAAKFAVYVADWQTKLNLNDWRIHQGSKPARGAMADMSIDVTSRLAVWRLGKHFGTELVTDQSLEATALHEVLHVLIADFALAVETKAADEVIESAEHRIINTLERLLVPPTKSQPATTSP